MLDALMRDLLNFSINPGYRINPCINARQTSLRQPNFRTVSLWFHFLNTKFGGNSAMNMVMNTI